MVLLLDLVAYHILDIHIDKYPTTSGGSADSVLGMSQEWTYWQDPSLSTMSIPCTSR